MELFEAVSASSHPSPDCLILRNGVAGLDTTPAFGPTMSTSSDSETNEGAVDVSCEDVADESPLGVVRPSDGVVEVPRGLDGVDRHKDLDVTPEAVGGDVDEDGRGVNAPGFRAFRGME